jgi:flagellar hook-associated protein 1
MLNLMVGLDIAMKSLTANSIALNTTSHNIANMNNADYSRQIADIAATDPYSIVGTAGQIGTGSHVSNYERIRDIYLDSQIQSAQMNVGKETIIDRTYQNLKAVIPEISGVTSNSLESQM